MRKIGVITSGSSRRCKRQHRPFTWCCQGSSKCKPTTITGAIVVAKRRLSRTRARCGLVALRADYETVQCLPAQTGRRAPPGKAATPTQAFSGTSLGSAVTHRHGEASPRR